MGRKGKHFARTVEQPTVKANLWSIAQPKRQRCLSDQEISHGRTHFPQERFYNKMNYIGSCSSSMRSIAPFLQERLPLLLLFPALRTLLQPLHHRSPGRPPDLLQSRGPDLGELEVQDLIILWMVNPAACVPQQARMRPLWSSRAFAEAQLQSVAMSCNQLQSLRFLQPTMHLRSPEVHCELQKIKAIATDCNRLQLGFHALPKGPRKPCPTD